MQPAPAYKPLDQMTKLELLDKCKKQRFVLQKLNKEIEDLQRELQYLKNQKK